MTHFITHFITISEHIILIVQVFLILIVAMVNLG